MNTCYENPVRNILLACRETIFPARCLLCGELLLFQNDKGMEICNPCYTSLEPLTGRRCAKCGMPLISEHQLCSRCKNRSYHFLQHISLFHYKSAIKELIYFYKFKKKHSLAHLFAYYLNTMIKTMFPHLPIVPVPSRSYIFKKQGRDHLTPIITSLKNDYNKSIINCLTRHGDSPQKKLSFTERVENLKGKIYIKKKLKMKEKEVLLIDDIFTTGATVDECSRVLLRNGVTSIYAISLAID